MLYPPVALVAAVFFSIVSLAVYRLDGLIRYPWLHGTRVPVLDKAAGPVQDEGGVASLYPEASHRTAKARGKQQHPIDFVLAFPCALCASARIDCLSGRRLADEG